MISQEFNSGAHPYCTLGDFATFGILFSDKISCILIAGGSIANEVRSKYNEILTEDLKIKQLPNLQQSFTTSMVLHNGIILLCGGYKNNEKKCFQLDHGIWKDHSILNEVRTSHSTVNTKTATFIFGGKGNSHTTYEYLPKDSTTWITGKTKIPMGFTNGSAIASKSGQKIWLIGGRNTEKRILAFDVRNHTFQELNFHLNVTRVGHRCAFIPNTDKIMITGGYTIGTNNYSKCLDSSEIIDLNEGRVSMASSMKYKRDCHGMSTITINGEDRLAVYGGFGGKKQRINSMEIYNNQTKKWETSKMKLKEPRANFSSLNLKLSELNPHSKNLQGSHNIFGQKL